MKTCRALTRKGTRCKHPAREFGLCAQHGRTRARSSGVSLDTAEKAAGLGANSIAIASGVISAVTFVTQHWGAIKQALMALGIAFISPYDDIETRESSHGLDSGRGRASDDGIRYLAEQSKAMTRRSSDILTRQGCPSEEAERLRRDFAMWFRSLPPEVQERAVAHVGRTALDPLL